MKENQKKSGVEFLTIAGFGLLMLAVFSVTKPAATMGYNYNLI